MTRSSERVSEAAPPSEEERGLLDGEQTAEGESGPAAEPPRVEVPRWVQLVVLPLALLALWALARAAGRVLLIFIVAAVIALILNPLVAFLQRSRLPRGLAVLAVYLAFFLALAGIGFLLANPISNQVNSFTHDLPHIVNEANRRIAKLQAELNQHGIHLHLVKQGKTALQSVQEKVAKSAGKLATSFGSLLTEVANAIFNLVLVFVLSVYMLLYGERIGALVRRVMPDGDGTMLQHSLFLYGSNMANSNAHNHYPLPTSMVGGWKTVKGGQHIVPPEHTPLANVLLTMLDRAGIPQDKLGDSTGKLMDV